MNAVRMARIATLGGYFGLLLLMLAWHAWLAPPAQAPVALVLMVSAVPLLLPLRGLLHGRRYTHGWTLFLALLYFTHGTVEAWADADVRVYALLEVTFSMVLFVGCILYIRASAD
jgi:uncharacterized membrane protein